MYKSSCCSGPPFKTSGRLVIQATLVETVGYGGLVRDRVCAQLAEGSLKAKEQSVRMLPHALPNVMVRFPCELNPQMIVRGKDNEPFLHQSAWPRSEILAQIGPH